MTLDLITLLLLAVVVLVCLILAIRWETNPYRRELKEFREEMRAYEEDPYRKEVSKLYHDIDKYEKGETSG